MTVSHTFPCYQNDSPQVEAAWFDEEATYETSTNEMAATVALKRNDSEETRTSRKYYDDKSDDESFARSAASAYVSPLVATPARWPHPVAAASAMQVQPQVLPLFEIRAGSRAWRDDRDADRVSENSLSTAYTLEQLEQLEADVESEAEQQSTGVLDYVLMPMEEEDLCADHAVDSWLSTLQPHAEQALQSMIMAPDVTLPAASLLAARYLDNTYTHFQFASQAATFENSERLIDLATRELFGLVPEGEQSQVWGIVQKFYEVVRGYRTAAEGAFVQCVAQMLVHLVRQESGQAPTADQLAQIVGYVLALAEIMRETVPEAYPSSDEEADNVVDHGEYNPHVLGVMLHFTRYFLTEQSRVMKAIFPHGINAAAIASLDTMLAPMQEQIARDCGEAADSIGTDATQVERGTMHPVVGLWERIHSLHMPMQYHDTAALWLQKYCTWVSGFLKQANPKDHFADRVFEDKYDFYRSAAEHWFMILRKMPLAYAELSEITSAISEYLPAQRGRKIIDYAKEHFDAQKMSMLPEKMGRMA